MMGVMMLETKTETILLNAPPLDEARHGRAVALELPPLAEEDETEFINADRQDLPEADGALWVRRAGMAAHPAAPNR